MLISVKKPPLLSFIVVPRKRRQGSTTRFEVGPAVMAPNISINNRSCTSEKLADGVGENLVRRIGDVPVNYSDDDAHSSARLSFRGP